MFLFWFIVISFILIIVVSAIYETFGDTKDIFGGGSQFVQSPASSQAKSRDFDSTFLEGNDFSHWSPSVHSNYEQRRRLVRAYVRYITFDDLDENRCVAIFNGSHLEHYRTSLIKCDCMDFQKRGLPCKHIYRLALELHLIDPPVNLDCIDGVDAIKEVSYLFDICDIDELYTLYNFIYKFKQNPNKNVKVDDIDYLDIPFRDFFFDVDESLRARLMSLTKNDIWFYCNTDDSRADLMKLHKSDLVDLIIEHHDDDLEDSIDDILIVSLKPIYRQDVDTLRRFISRAIGKKQKEAFESENFYNDV